MNPTPKPREILTWLTGKLPEMIETLQTLVCAESPSTDKAAADAGARVVADEWRKRGGKLDLFKQKHRGAHIRITHPSAPGESKGQLLVLGHYDTVYAPGILAKMPFRSAAGRIYGPGVFDMKAGIVQALYALEALQNFGVALSKTIVFLWTSDEEIGSESSRKLIESEAKRSQSVFVLEPSLGAKGLLKTTRKGVGEAEIIVHGRASHAGLAPEKGVNAIHELAMQLARVRNWNDLPRGISVNAGTIEGGTRSNVIPEFAKSVLDLRALRTSDMQRIEKAHALKPISLGAKVEVHGGFNRPPMERKYSRRFQTRSAAQRDGFNDWRSHRWRRLRCQSDCRAWHSHTGRYGRGRRRRSFLGEHIIARAMPQRAALLAVMLLNC
jgi:glutamate carboxypeptidase